MTYSIVIAKQALKELEKLPLRMNVQISSAIDALSSNPRPAGCKKLKGDQEYIWRIRVGSYRILYTINDPVRIVEIRKIGDRKNIYK